MTVLIFFCFMPVVIMSETSHRHCVSNSATSRNKDALHLLSHQICIVAQEKYTYTFTYIRSLGTLYTFYKYKIKTGILLYCIFFFFTRGMHLRALDDGLV